MQYIYIIYIYLLKYSKYFYQFSAPPPSKKRNSVIVLDCVCDRLWSEEPMVEGTSTS